jgi:hypothetical protein
MLKTVVGAEHHVLHHVTNTHDGEGEPEGGLKPEKVEDRENVSMVTPDDYPKDRPDS